MTAALAAADFDLCVEGCGRPAVAERTTGVILEDHPADPADPLIEVVEQVCAECAGVVAP